MIYTVSISKKAKKELTKLDKPTASLIIGWLKKNIEGSTNPRNHGKALSGNHKGYWRYRIGDYRALCEIMDEEVIVYIVEVGHRKEIYKRG